MLNRIHSSPIILPYSQSPSAPSTMSTHLLSKISSLTSINTDSIQFLEALDAVATFQATHKPTTTTTTSTLHPNTNSSTNLRHQLEQHGQVLVEDFLDSFEPLRTKLYSLERAVQDLDENSQQVESELEKVRAHTSNYVTVLGALQKEQIVLGRRTQMIENFLDTARMSDTEATTLRQCNFSLDSDIQHFFVCLNKLKRIRCLENELSTGWARTAGLQLVARPPPCKVLVTSACFCGYAAVAVC